MDNINLLQENVAVLEHKSADITDIISTITGISGQTNLLALKRRWSRYSIMGNPFVPMQRLPDRCRRRFPVLTAKYFLLCGELEGSAVRFRGTGKDYGAFGRMVQEFAKAGR